MTKKTFWKVWLKKNALTKNVENDFTAEVSTAGNTLRNEDIAARVVSARSEMRLETILSIFTMRDEIVRDALLQGTAVQDGCVHISPRVGGNWIGLSHVFDPSVHKIGLDISPTAEMRAALETVGVRCWVKKTRARLSGLLRTSARAGRTAR
jgi:hypothetical protein